jgi:hypothetical protein
MSRSRGLVGATALMVLVSGLAFQVGAPLAKASAQQSAYLGRGMPYAAFDKLPADLVEVGGGRIHVAVAPGELGQSKAAVLEWVERSARMISAYYGRFPVRDVRLLIVPVDGGEIHGTTWGYRGAAIRIPLGHDVPESEMLDSWVLPHEFVHLALPSLDDDQRWLEEGTATYVEAVARVRTGQQDETGLWRELIRDMPQGLPQAGDKGLDHTHTWGRTYWGGAVYCLIADVTIHQRSGNRYGLQDALSAIVAVGGNVTQEWPVDEVLAIGDRATGTTVLQDLYAAAKDFPLQIDLDGLWRRLGVSLRDGRIVLDDSAPLSDVRRAIATVSSNPD